MPSSQVLCFGESLVDRLGTLGGDPSIDGKFQDCLGGAPSNVACALARLGVNVALIGCLGDDSIANSFLKLFNDRGVNVDALQINHNLPSRIVLVRRDIDGERSFDGFHGDLGKGFADQSINLSSLKNIWSNLSASTKWLLAGTIPLASELSKEALLWTLDNANNQNIKIAIDVNWRPTFWSSKLLSNSPPTEIIKETIKKVLMKASLLKLAKEEAIYFFNTASPLDISNSLPNKPDVIVTDGSRPIKWLMNGFSGEFNTFSPSSVIDTTGAGDSFTAGLISQIIFKDSLPPTFLRTQETISFAAACGALVCSGAGAIEPQPKLSEVKDFLSGKDIN